ncbi:MAG: 3-deoxy-manno-octulosonate cytidylyltransferase [Leptolyngbya sp. PLA1]|nr:3-deoxy-manno-octulosonate cytidylyltransferase [Leptolyngbya sp. PLA1]
MDQVIAIIPARLGSTRFPGKVIADRTGHPLIWHVWTAARRACPRVVVAADDARVVDAVRGFGGECVLTRPDHPNGSSRLAEATRLLNLPDETLVVNVQGDEPEIEPGVIAAAIDAARRPGVHAGTVASPLAPGDDPTDPNLVKVVLDAEGRALYFSRAHIPHRRSTSGRAPALRHVGIYAYRVAFLRTYVGLTPTPLEETEVLEQLRILEHGYRIGVSLHASTPQGIDTPEQYDAFVARWRAAKC